MNGLLQLAESDATFFDDTFLYIAGGALIVFAIAIAFLGLRSESFPSSSQLRGIGAVAVVLVICTGIGAVESARFEQAQRRAENEEAAKESQAENIGKQEQEAPLTEGEGAAPDTATGEASSPPEGGGAADIDGKALFADSGCGDCHTLADAGTTGQIGPVLDEVLPDMSEAQIRTSIVDPGDTVEKGFPDGVMPTVYGDQFTPAELDALVAYLSSAAGK